MRPAGWATSRTSSAPRPRTSASGCSSARVRLRSRRPISRRPSSISRPSGRSPWRRPRRPTSSRAWPARTGLPRSSRTSISMTTTRWTRPACARSRRKRKPPPSRSTGSPTRWAPRRAPEWAASCWRPAKASSAPIGRRPSRFPAQWLPARARPWSGTTISATCCISTPCATRPRSAGPPRRRRCDGSSRASPRPVPCR